MGGAEVEDTIEAARSWLAYPGAPAIEPGEEIATRFAKTVVKLAGACIVGVSCDRHGGAVHGHEAEELRKGIERIFLEYDDVMHQPDEVNDMRAALRRLLDEIDARDSLAFLEATTCNTKGCLHHAAIRLGSRDARGPCAGCNCCDSGSE
jgi:hypothetical protein